MKTALDHIAIACTDLQATRLWAEDLLGVPFSDRGKHTAMGTHNHLVSLGPDIYLELIAIDPAAPGPGRPRWFDLDHFIGPKRLTNWICQTDDINAALAVAPAGSGVPISLTRGDFKWQMAVPENGILPYDQCFPALIEWDGPHPAARLPDHGLRLKSLTLTHPDAAALRRALAPLGQIPDVSVQDGAQPGLVAEIDTPNGTVTLK